MKKADIIAALQKAGVEHDPAATVAVLTTLANEKGVDLKSVPDLPEDQPASSDAAAAGAPGLSPVEAEAKAEVEAMKPVAAPTGITETAIAEKTRLGLSRKQAIEILTNQAEHDARLAEEEKAKG